MQTLSSPISGSPPSLYGAFPRLTTERCYALAGRTTPWFGWTAGLLSVIGLLFGFLVAPTDIHQGDHYRIAFIHIPTLWLSVFLYALMAATSAYGLLAGDRLAAMSASALAPTGALFAFLALWTGSLWGKPMWGAWWIWDARLSSELLVLFLFLGFIALQEAIEDPRRADRAAGLLALVGLVGLPLLYFAISRWSQAHGAHARGLTAPIDSGGSIRIGLICMSLGLLAYAVAATLTRLRNEILKRERSSDWVNRHTLNEPR